MSADNAKIQAEASITVARMQKDTQINSAIDLLLAEKRRLDFQVFDLEAELEEEEVLEPPTKRSKSITRRLGFIRQQIQDLLKNKAAKEAQLKELNTETPRRNNRTPDSARGLRAGGSVVALAASLEDDSAEEE